MLTREVISGCQQSRPTSPFNAVCLAMLECRLIWVILTVSPAYSLITNLLFETLQRVQFMAVGLPGMWDTAPKPVVGLA